MTSPSSSGSAASRHKNSRGSIIAMGLGALLFLGVLGFVALGGSGDSDETPVATSAAPTSSDTSSDSEPVAAPADEPTAVPEATEVPAPTPEPTPEPEPTPAPEPTATPEPAPAVIRPAVFGPDSPPVPPGAPESYSVLSGGKIYLRGALQSTELEDAVVSSLEPILGVGNVISEYSIDPASELTLDQEAKVYVADPVLFESGSSAISPDYFPLISTAPIMLQLQPTSRVTILGHTDSLGDAESNLVLSQQRVDAVRDWIISQGGDPERVVAIGKGEAEPVADNETEEGRQANRRVEFLVDGFDFGDF